MVATDQISAFDFVLESLIPDKGAVLTQLSQWWFGRLGDLVDNHVISTDVPEAVRGRAVDLRAAGDDSGGVRGSGLSDRVRLAGVSADAVGVRSAAAGGSARRVAAGRADLHPGDQGGFGEHDENVSYDVVVGQVGAEVAERIRDLTLAVYATAEGIARDRGILLADTKLEFGRRPDGTIVLADEVLTPDSSRFWDADAWERGVLDSYDKQYVRNWLLRESGWTGTATTHRPRCRTRSWPPRASATCRRTSG